MRQFHLRMMFIVGYCFCLAWPAAIYAQVEKSRVTSGGAATLETLLKRWHEKTGGSVICDAYPGETYRETDYSWMSLPADKAIRELSQRNGREVVIVEGIYVLRSRKWAAKRPKSVPPQIMARWGDSGVTKAQWTDNGFALVASLFLSMAVRR